MRVLISLLLITSLISCSSGKVEVTTPRLNRLSAAIEQGNLQHGYQLDLEERHNTFVLRGEVGSASDKAKVEQIARNEFPSRNIRNEMTVNPSLQAGVGPTKMVPRQPRTNAEIEQQIRSIIMASAPKGERIHYNVSPDRQLTLTGDLDSFKEVDAILADMQMVQDLNSVRNEITVQGQPYNNDFARFQSKMRR